MSGARLLHAREFRERQEWLALVASDPRSQPACFPAYLELFKDPSDEAALLVVEQDSSVGVMPMLLRAIPDPAGSGTTVSVDIAGPYGYGTAAWIGAGQGDPAHFWHEVEFWARGLDIVSIVCRLPVVSGWIEWTAAAHAVMPNVVVPIRDPDDVWMGFQHKVRKNVKKAQRSGVTIEIGRSERLVDDFLEIYHDTMARRESDSRFVVSRESVGSLLAELGHRHFVAVAYIGGDPISSELVLSGGDATYSFLGGTRAEAFGFRPNDLLKFEVINYGRDAGFQSYVLGGGPGGDDGIFRYKRSFAPESVVEFNVGEMIVDDLRYQELASLSARSVGAPRWPRYR